MTELTISALKADGWTQPKDGITLIEKIISADDNDYGDGLQPMVLEVNRDFNQEQFSLRMPDGAKLDLSFDNMEQIISFEERIMGWRPVY